MEKRNRVVAAVVGLAVAMSCGTASAVTSFAFTTGNFKATGIGAEDPWPLTGFDKLTITGISQAATFDLAVGQTITRKIGELAFDVGGNSWTEHDASCTARWPITMTVTAPLPLPGAPGFTQQLVQDFTVSIADSDTLYSFTGQTLYFDFGSHGVLVATPQAIAPIVSEGGLQRRDLMAEFALQAPVPEPLTMASAFLAVGGLGVYIRGRVGVR